MCGTRRTYCAAVYRYPFQGGKFAPLLLLKCKILATLFLVEWNGMFFVKKNIPFRQLLPQLSYVPPCASHCLVLSPTAADKPDSIEQPATKISPLNGTDSMQFLKQPIQLTPNVKIVSTSENPGILALSSRTSASIEGEISHSILNHIDGQRTGQQIVNLLRTEHGPFAVVETLVEMHKARAIEVCRSQKIAAPHQALASALGLAEIPHKLAPVAVQSIGDVQSTQLEQLLRSVAIEKPKDDSEAGVDILLTDSYFRPEIAAHNQHATRPWLPVQASGEQGWIGPLIVPNDSACWSCFYHRLSRNFEAQHLWWTQNEHNEPLPSLDFPLLGETTLNMSVQLVLRWLLQPDKHPLINQLVTVDPLLLAIEQHPVTKRPQCPTCGMDNLLQRQPIILSSQAATGSNESGHRLLSAESMLVEYGDHIDPITGIVPRLSAQTDDIVTHVYGANYVNGELAKSWEQLSKRKYNNAGGKGATNAQAQASALGEAIERFSSAWDGTEEHFVARWDDLPGRAYRPNELMLFSDTQHAQREQANEFYNDYKSRVPNDYAPDEPLAWTRTWSLSKQEWVLLPASYAYFGYHGPGTKYFCISDSNGNAAGTSMEDAILQGFYELVERDSVALWWYNQVRRPGVNLDGVNDAYIAQLREHYAKVHREFWVLDITSDLGIPAFVALSRRMDDGPEQITAGFGAHMESQIAIIRALTEMNQLMPAALKGIERIDRRLPEPGDPQTLLDVAVGEHPYLLPDPDLAATDWEAFKTPNSTDLKSEIDYCRTLVEARGMEMLVLDLTRPDLKLPVVKVTVPGMRHFWRRLAPGRLYDTPVELGWIEMPKAESDLNPIQLTG